MRVLRENRNIPFDEPGWLFGNLYANRLIVFVGTNVQTGSRRKPRRSAAGSREGEASAGKGLLRRGDSRSREEGFRLIVADEPKNSLAWFHLGQIHMARREMPRRARP